MTEPQSQRGGKRPNTGGARPGAGRKPNVEKGLPPGRSVSVACAVEPDIKDWLDENGGSALHYQILREAYIKGHVDRKSVV